MWKGVGMQTHFAVSPQAFPSLPKTLVEACFSHLASPSFTYGQTQARGVSPGSPKGLWPSKTKVYNSWVIILPV